MTLDEELVEGVVDSTKERKWLRTWQHWLSIPSRSQLLSPQNALRARHARLCEIDSNRVE